ncbi:hypothetical protein EDC65_2882 [Stella humosa]|uniref:Uncharacterized protein n=1 Tax=Stella humosa TaxID=94 RepID=A0A3N1LI50_9PROT|nr:hypothetical protein [Stella humosa]ROP91022.1 hypothetical protein EDC65_2882 [Stella humosa]BBK34628.1 hypothetical protein STHU_52620 [Stella humosa]
MTTPDPLDPLLLDLVEWVARRPRPYGEVIDAWRTSCPRLTVWEEAVDRGLVVRKPAPGQGAVVAVTELGRRWIEGYGRGASPPPG